MDERLRRKIAEAAHAEHGWKPEEVHVDEAQTLRRETCSFYEVRHTVLPLSYLANYALLPDGRVVGPAGKGAAARILDGCGNGAPAGWWAEVVTRFHESLGEGAVLHDEAQDAEVIRKMREAGKSFSPPSLRSEGGTKKLSFYLMEYEAYILFQVTATRQADGTLQVSETEVF
jgi:hypothetical protein